jgi:hypothetical protein
MINRDKEMKLAQLHMIALYFKNAKSVPLEIMLHITALLIVYLRLSIQLQDDFV